MTTSAENCLKETDGEPGSGAHSIAGYEYQIDVSVWLALDLVLQSRLAAEIVLEPFSEEDLESDLDPVAPGGVTNHARVGGYRLIVQAKRRTGDAWTVAAVRALLLHGTHRASAKERLADPNARYLLVTSAGLNGMTRGLQVQHPGNWPRAKDTPASIRSALTNGAEGRVAIIATHNDERLSTKIKAQLQENFRVPRARLEACHYVSTRTRAVQGSRPCSARYGNR